jgi:hypothetical protein
MARIFRGRGEKMNKGFLGMVLVLIISMTASIAFAGDDISWKIGSGRNPAIYDNKVVSWDVSGDVSLRDRNVKPTALTIIDCEEAAYPDIGEKYMTWVDKIDGRYKIAICDIETLDVYHLESEDVDVTSRPRVCGDRVVWGADNFSYIYEISTGIGDRIFSAYHPDIYGDKVVYDFWEGESYRVAVYDIRADERIVIPYEYNLERPRIYGDKVIACCANSGPGGLILYDIATGEIKEIVSPEIDIEKSDCVPDAGIAYAISEKWIVYGRTYNCQDHSAGVYAYDMESGEHYLISPNMADGLGVTPDVCGDTAVWGYCDAQGLVVTDMDICVCPDLNLLATRDQSDAADSQKTGRLVVMTDQSSATYSVCIAPQNTAVATGSGKEWSADLPVGNYVIYFGGLYGYFCKSQGFTLTTEGKTIYATYLQYSTDTTIAVPYLKNDYGRVRLPEGIIPGWEEMDIPLYIPPIKDKTNAQYEEEGWTEVAHITKDTVSIDKTKLGTALVVDANYPENQGAFGYEVIAQGIVALDKAFTEYGADIIVQENSEGEKRAIVRFADDDLSRLYEDKAGFTVIFDSCSIRIDKAHAEQEYIAYLSLARDGRIMYTPIVYPQDLYNLDDYNGNPIHAVGEDYVRYMKCVVTSDKENDIRQVMSPCELVLKRPENHRRDKNEGN